MELDTVISKTAEGMREARGASRRLPEESRRVLREVNGRLSVAELASQAGLAAGQALALCARLAAEGFVHEVERASGKDLDLDFTVPSARPGDANRL